MAGQSISLPVLRQLFRNIQQFRALYETEGVDEIVAPDGARYSLFDLEYLYDEGLPKLSKRQRQAIILCLIANMVEQDVAVAMGIAPSNPVAMYSNDGLRRIIAMMQSGELRSFGSPSLDFRQEA